MPGKSHFRLKCQIWEKAAQNASHIWASYFTPDGLKLQGDIAQNVAILTADAKLPTTTY